MLLVASLLPAAVQGIRRVMKGQSQMLPVQPSCCQWKCSPSSILVVVDGGSGMWLSAMLCNAFLCPDVL
jgi:hypothetical protein